MITISNTKVMTLNVITPPGTRETVSRAIFKPGTTWGTLKSKVPTPNLQGAPFQHWSQTVKGEAIQDDVQFDTTSTIYGVFSETVVLTIENEYKLPVVRGTTVRAALKVLPAFRKQGFSFSHFSETADGDPVDASKVIKQDMTLHAVFLEDASSHEVVFSTGELFEPMAKIHVKPATQWSLLKNRVPYPTPAKELAVFSNWSLTENGGPIEDGYLFNGPVTIYAVGSEATEKINISFDSHGGTMVQAMQQPKGVKYGYIRQLIQDPVRKTDADRHDEFVGWALKTYADNDIDREYKFEASAVLHAQWLNLIEVKVRNNGTERSVSKEANYFPYSEAMAKITVEQDGIPAEHTFKHWSLRPNGNAMPTEGAFIMDTDVFAVYEPYAEVSVNVHGATTGADQVVKVPAGTKWSAIKDRFTAPAKAEFVFKHWSLTNNGVVLDDEHAFSGKVVIHAVFEPYAVVSFEVADGLTQAPIKVPKGSKWSDVKGQITVSKPGFRPKPVRGDTELTDNDIMSGDETIKIEFVKVWNVTFDADGGSPTPDTVVVDEGTTWGQIKDRVPSPSKAGMRFTGWELK